MDVNDSKNFVEKLKNYDVPIAVNFIQSTGVVLADMLESKKWLNARNARF